MLKLVSWIDSLPRLTAHRRKNSVSGGEGQQQSKRRLEKIKAKSTTSTPLIKHKNEEKTAKKWKRSQLEKPTVENRPPASINSAIRAIGRRRYTEPDAFRRATNSPLRALSPSSILSPRVYVSSPTDEEESEARLMSMSWHPQGIERVQSFKIDTCDQKSMSRSLISSHPVSCSVQEIVTRDEMASNLTLQSQSATRPQIRTNPWVRPKSPRVIPALDLSCSGSLSTRNCQKEQRRAPAGSQVLETDDNRKKSNGKDDSSVYSLRSSSGYASGGSQDSSPASSIHTPDWQNLSISRYGSTSLRSTTNSSSNLRTSNRGGHDSKSREDVGLQCDLTEDKSVECTEEDFLPFLERDENGNIPMIDDDEGEGTEESDCYEDGGHVCGGLCQQDWAGDPPDSIGKSDSENSLGKSGLGGKIEELDSGRRRAYCDSGETDRLDVDYSSGNTELHKLVQKSCLDSITENPELDSRANPETASSDEAHSEDSDAGSKKSKAVLSMLHAKVEQLKANSDHVTQAVRTAKEEQRKRNGELRVYEEQMQFLKQLKLAISNGFEVLV